MGLKFYRTSGTADAGDAAAKLDRAAAQARSAIRREPSVRPGRDQSSSTGLTNIIRNRSELTNRQARLRALYDRQEADAQIELLEAELARLRRSHRRPPPRNPTESSRLELELQIAQDLNPNSNASADTDVFLTSNDNDVPPPSHTADTPILLPRPARESNLRFEVAATSSTRPASPQVQQSFMLSPPHSQSDGGNARPVDGPLEPWHTSTSFTRNFAPARAALDAQNEETTEAVSEIARIVNENDQPGLATPPPDAWEGSYPPLRRVPHMSPRPLPRVAVDGLGDRRRSPTPPSDAHEEETWNHLLSTMDYSNNRTSSAATSFASMTDLLSTSRTSSYRSPGTQNTSASFGEIGTSADDSCDLPPGITEDDARLLRERHRRTAARVHAPHGQILRSRHPRQDINADDARDSPGSPLSILLEEAREARASQDRRRQRRRDELIMLHAIAARQHGHQGDIPDEWWALAGLAPDLTESRNDA